MNKQGWTLVLFWLGYFLAVAIFAGLLIGCAEPRKVTQVVLPPDELIAPVTKPDKPNPKTATQKDVALWLIELNSTLDRCINQQQVLTNWKTAWMNWNEQRK